jgi:small subunit ribosomal protein S18
LFRKKTETKPKRGKPERGGRPASLPPRKRAEKYTLPADVKIEYKNLALLQKYVTDRGKIVPRRFSGVSGKNQRELSLAIKRARYLGLLAVGSAKRRYMDRV